MQVTASCLCADQCFESELRFLARPPHFSEYNLATDHPTSTPVKTPTRAVKASKMPPGKTLSPRSFPHRRVVACLSHTIYDGRIAPGLRTPPPQPQPGSQVI